MISSPAGSVDNLSPLLQAMGVPTEEGTGALTRFSLGRATTEAEIRGRGRASDLSRRDHAGRSGSDRLTRRVGAVHDRCSCPSGMDGTRLSQPEGRLS